MYCSNCGVENRDDAQFCFRCGKMLRGKTDSIQDQSNRTDYNVIISCMSAHKKAYAEMEAGGVHVRVNSGESKQLLLPIGNNKLRFFTRRYGLTWVKTKDRYERDLYIQPGDVYIIEVQIGQSTNRINIHT